MLAEHRRIGKSTGRSDHVEPKCLRLESLTFPTELIGLCLNNSQSLSHGFRVRKSRAIPQVES